MYGAIITVLFLAAIVVLTYRRLGLLAFCCTLTLLLALYCYLAPPAPLWKSLLWIFTALLWLLNVKPLRRTLVSGLSADAALDVADREGGARGRYRLVGR
jgi:hypothetical protein